MLRVSCRPSACSQWPLSPIVSIDQHAFGPEVHSDHIDSGFTRICTGCAQTAVFSRQCANPQLPSQNMCILNPLTNQHGDAAVQQPWQLHRSDADLHRTLQRESRDSRRKCHCHSELPSNDAACGFEQHRKQTWHLNLCAFLCMQGCT